MVHKAEFTHRHLLHRVNGVATSDGAGVQLTRMIGAAPLSTFDPFLLFDYFASERPEDYINGFPEHPHRGFETVTYLLNGRMRHKDNAGHEGVIEPGGVQWMTAGRGILHSEMPEQKDGLLRGIQVWVNLPASAKMTQPAYQEFPCESVPLEQRHDGTQVRVIAGQTDLGTTGVVKNTYTSATFLDISLPPHCQFQQALPVNQNAFVYVIEGDISIGEQAPTSGPEPKSGDCLSANELGVLSTGQRVVITNSGGDARVLLLAGSPLLEPVARGGPFVMNTREEVLQAFKDFSDGRF